MMTDGSSCSIINSTETIAIGERIGKLYLMEFKVQEGKRLEHLTVGAEEPTLRTWHQRLAHKNYAHVQKFLKDSNIQVRGQPEAYEPCASGKMHRKPFKRSTSKTTRVGELVHADVCGYMEEEEAQDIFFC